MNEQKPEGIFIGLYDEAAGGRVFSVNSTWTTIQGEGPFAGHPATFIRLAGCNLQCPGCDTEYTRRTPMTTRDLTRSVVQNGRNLVVITGGEPFRHAYLQELIISIRKERHTVQVETNGTYLIEAGLATIVCSPKTPKLHGSCEHFVNAWKYVVSHDAIDSSDGLPTSVLGMKKPPCRPLNKASVYIQPADSKNPVENEKNLKAAVEVCEEFGYILCLQIQKIVGLK